MNKPIGVSEYKFTQELLEEYKEALPDTNELVDSILKPKSGSIILLRVWQ